jgi:N-acetylneuraminic acid mutarotase
LKADFMKRSYFVGAISLVIPFVQSTAALDAGVFTSTGSLGTGRYSHTATPLANGKVLVAGGESYYFDSGGNIEDIFFTSAELYDPASGLWTLTGSLANERSRHTATLLPNGKVLVAGGYFSAGGYTINLASAELYDPASGSWSATASLHTASAGHTATLLPNGKVLVVGASTELYNPATATWSLTGNPSILRAAGYTATLLPNGKVLVAGGGTNRAELYNPTNGTWALTGSLGTSRSSHTATLLPNGKVLVAGGEVFQNGSGTIAFNSAELYDPAVGTWSPTGSLGNPRYNHTASLMPNGKVLAVGGIGNSDTAGSAELYDPATGTWSLAGSLGTSRYSHTATLKADGKVLVAGGFSGFAPTASAELYVSSLNPITNPTRLGDGSFQFRFSNPSGSSYSVLASTNVAAPLNTWSNLGTATETPPGSGQFLFTDSQATNYPRRFYRVSSP